MEVSQSEVKPKPELANQNIATETVAVATDLQKMLPKGNDTNKPEEVPKDGIIVEKSEKTSCDYNKPPRRMETTLLNSSTSAQLRADCDSNKAPRRMETTLLRSDPSAQLKADSEPNKAPRRMETTLLSSDKSAELKAHIQEKIENAQKSENSPSATHGQSGGTTPRRISTTLISSNAVNSTVIGYEFAYLHYAIAVYLQARRKGWGGGIK